MEISIITATWNAEKTIVNLLESIKLQDLSPCQLIIVDNCSTDNTVDIVRSYEDRYKSLGIELDLIIEKDTGIYEAINKGLRIAKGRWINIIGADDCFCAEVFAKITMTAKQSYFDILHANIEVVGREGHSYIARPRLDVETISRGMMLFHPTLFISRETYNKIGYYSSEFKLSGDYEWLYRAVSAKAVFHYLNETTVRHCATGVSTQRRNLGLKENDLIRKRMNVKIPFRLLYYFREKYFSPHKRKLIIILDAIMGYIRDKLLVKLI